MPLPRHSPIISGRPCRLIALAQGWARLGTSTCCAKTCLHCLVALYLQKITVNISYFVAGTSHLQTITLNVCSYEEMTSYRHTPALNLYSSWGSDMVPTGHSLHIWSATSRICTRYLLFWSDVITRDGSFCTFRSDDLTKRFYVVVRLLVIDHIWCQSRNKKSVTDVLTSSRLLWYIDEQAQGNTNLFVFLWQKMQILSDVIYASNCQ